MPSLPDVTVSESLSAGDLFDGLIVSLYKKHNEKVAVLIDEKDELIEKMEDIYIVVSG